MEWFFAQLFSFLAFALDIAMFITTPIYILLLITLWKNRNEETLKHAFFKLMLSIGVADVGTILNIFLTFRLAEWGWVPQIFIWLGGMSARIAMVGTNLFSIAQVLGILVVAVNRYTAFMMPLRHQKLWRDGKLLTWLIAGSWITAFLLTIPIMFIFQYKIYISEDDPTNRTIYLQWVNASDLFYYAIAIAFIFKPLIVLFVFITYGVIFVVTFRTSHKSARVATMVEKVALNMSIVGFVHCIGLAISVYFFIAQEISWFGFNYNLVDIVVITFVNNLGNDLFSAINPYALLIFSKPVRTQFFKMYRIPMISIPFSGKTNVTPLGGDSTRAAGQIDKNIEL